MNNPKPIKRHQALVAFSREHHFGLLLVWKIRQGLDNAIAPERISRYVLYFFEQDLEDHFAAEEQELFPLLPVDHSLRLQAEKEHALTRKLIEEIRIHPGDKNLLLQFAQALQDHIRFEERQLFAVIQEIAADILSAHQDRHSKDPDIGWDDVFWTAGSRQNK